MQKVIIAGSRNATQYDMVRTALNRIFKEPFIVISGCATGADKLGECYAKEYNLQVERYPADWKNLNAEPCYVKHNSHGAYNALAGHNRNRQMLQAVLNNPDGGCVVAFWNGKSSGTRNMIHISQAVGIPVHIIRYE